MSAAEQARGPANRMAEGVWPTGRCGGAPVNEFARLTVVRLEAVLRERAMSQREVARLAGCHTRRSAGSCAGRSCRT